MLTYEYTTDVANKYLMEFFYSIGKTTVSGSGEESFFATVVGGKMRIIGIFSAKVFKVSYFDTAVDVYKPDFEKRLKEFLS